MTKKLAAKVARVGKNMRYGPIVAEKFKRQYIEKKKGAKKVGWKTYESWEIQPEQIYLICKELKSKEAIEALLNCSWTKRLPKSKVKK